MSAKKFSLHGIQLKKLDVQELHFSANDIRSDSEQIDESMFQLTAKHTAYDSAQKTIGVMLEVKMGHGDEPVEGMKPCPYDLWVAVAGLFVVNEESFNVNFIEDWAARSAPLILYPYLRENVYTLAARGGFNGVLLPLFEVPTIKYQMPQSD